MSRQLLIPMIRRFSIVVFFALALLTGGSAWSEQQPNAPPVPRAAPTRQVPQNTRQMAQGYSKLNQQVSEINQEQSTIERTATARRNDMQALGVQVQG